MSSQCPNHAESSHPPEKQSPTGAPKLHVQRSLSKENITIHFSALGTEEEEEEDNLCITTACADSSAQKDTEIVTALEASEDIFEEIPEDSTAPIRESSNSPTPPVDSNFPEKKTSTTNIPPVKSLSFPSSLVKSFTSDGESRDVLSSTSSLRHRQLVKSLVKSLSTDTSQDASSSSTSIRLPEPRLNLQLFKQFGQSRGQVSVPASVNDSKTAPCSPLTSQEHRSFFKVSDVESKFEDTKRRLTEAISEPLLLLSKIMDEKSGGSGIYRPKGFSASATEISTNTSVNGHLETNNYSIKEEEGADSEAESPNSWASLKAETLDTKTPHKLSSLSMSALAKQEEEEYCILNNEDFEICTDSEADGLDGVPQTGCQVPLSGSLSCSDENESQCVDPSPSVPVYTLVFLTFMIYGYFVLPLPNYLCGVMLGIGMGFFLAIGVVWLTGPKQTRLCRNQEQMWNINRLDIKEPDIYKGWMNEIGLYNPETYHATLTHSVYVRLEGSIIRLSKPSKNIPRRASHNEPKPDMAFISQKIYDLSNSKVYLVPPNLARKRIWNKKYPICIKLGKQDDFMSKTEDDRMDSDKTLSLKDRERSSGAQERPSSKKEVTLYLFGRTGREKEDWFQKFLLASNVRVGLKRSPSVGCTKKVTTSGSHTRSSSRSSLDEVLSPQPKTKDSTLGSAKNQLLLDYNVYMGCLVPNPVAESLTASSSAASFQSSPGADKKLQSATPAQVQPKAGEEDSVAWLNAAVGRLFWDFLTEAYWREQVSKKIQMKLSKIRLPYFMSELKLTELDMGSTTPRILGASAPYVDYQGLWVDLEVSYNGSFLMTLETKMILNRLRKDGDFGKDGRRSRISCLADSEEESSSAGSSDEDDSSDVSNEATAAESLVGGHKPSKIMRFVDKITKSKYFQKATETEFIKKKMAEVSNTPLLLTVEVQQLQGTLAVNIPPPPTDRIWYGFRTPPHLELKARPKLGEIEVTLAHVTDWIEKKLYQEFQKILVMPNMDDLWLTIMHSATDQRTAGGPLVSPSADSEPL